MAGHISDSSVGLISHDAGRLTLTIRSATRSPSPAPVSWQVPDEVVQTLAEVPGTALSVTEYAPDKDSLEIYLLCEADGMRRIHVYDALKKTQRTLPGEFGCSEIVMAK